MQRLKVSGGVRHPIRVVGLQRVNKLSSHICLPAYRAATCYSTVVLEFRRFQYLRIYTGMNDRTPRHVVSIPAS